MPIRSTGPSPNISRASIVVASVTSQEGVSEAMTDVRVSDAGPLEGAQLDFAQPFTCPITQRAAIGPMRRQIDFAREAVP